MMFELLVEIGFKEIEIGFPAASEVEYQFTRQLIDEDRIPPHVTIQVLTPAREALIEKTFAAVAGANKVIIHLYNSTSTVQRRVTFGLDKAGVKALAVNGANTMQKLRAKLNNPEAIRFQYSPESFTGTELDYALDVCHAVMDVWQPTPENKVIINFPATVEMCMPNVYADQIEWCHRHLQNRESVVLSIHTHNDRGTAVAAGELAVMAGAERVEGTLFGNGERAGNMDVMTMALNLFSQGVDPQLDFSNLGHIQKIFQQCTAMPIHPRHPYAGELVFTAFSGSHQDAINKSMKAQKECSDKIWDVPYLPIDPQDVGRFNESLIRINSQSGKGGVAYVLEQISGLKLSRDMQIEVGRVVQKLADELGRELSPQEIGGCFEREYLYQYDPHSSVAPRDNGQVWHQGQTPQSRLE
jgi:2-isopropylmalate synthase